MWKQTKGYDFLLSILCLLLLPGFSCSQDPETVSLGADSSTTLQCSDDKVLAFDRVEHGDDDCSVQVYRNLSTSCLRLSSCIIDTLAYDCASSGLIVEYRCVEDDQIIDVCSVNGETIGPMELMYLTSPGYPSDTEYEKDLDCIVNYNEGKVSSTYLLDISMEPRDTSGTGCLDRLRIRANHTRFGPDMQIDEVCGDNTHNLEGSSWASTYWLDQYSMSLRFRTDDFFNDKYRGFILRVDSFPPATTTSSTTSTPTTTAILTTTISSTTTAATTTATFITPSTTTMSSPSSAATSTMSTSTTSSTYSTTDPFDDCAGNPCQNGGTCNDDLDLYVCRCPTGYTGTNCEVSDLDTIVETTISTASSGSSSPSMSAVSTTESIRTVVNECDSQPCQNGGTCEDDLHMYKCTCPSGFAGDMCEILVPVSAANVIWSSCLTIGLLVCHLPRHL